MHILLVVVSISLGLFLLWQTIIDARKGFVAFRPAPFSQEPRVQKKKNVPAFWLSLVVKAIAILALVIAFPFLFLTSNLF